jgi:hypothetical protein
MKTISSCARVCGIELERKLVRFPDGQTATISVCPKCKMEVWDNADMWRWQILNEQYNECNPPDYKWLVEPPKQIVEPDNGKAIPWQCAMCGKNFMLKRHKFFLAANKDNLTCSNKCRVDLQNKRSHEYKLRSLARAQRVQPTRRGNKNR